MVLEMIKFWSLSRDTEKIYLTKEELELIRFGQYLEATVSITKLFLFLFFVFVILRFFRDQTPTVYPKGKWR